MHLRPPTDGEVRELGEHFFLDLTDDEVRDYQQLMTDTLAAYDTVRAYDAAGRDHAYDHRTGGHRVERGEDPYNAWVTACEVTGADDGPLAGVDVGIKDNVSVAGVEMTCGSQVLEGYVPDVDATIVTRLLEAGATIVGKTNMDDMAFTGNGHSSAFGPTLNPHDPDYLSGGSSGGSAIAVATGEVDLAIGGDQGGSIRAPASWTGIVGHKPTYGLVPYTGIVGVENTIDHTGPMARDVPMAARALTVMAGKDPDDPRQPDEVPTTDYEAGLSGDIEGLSIGVVEQGFDRPEAQSAVNERVRAGLASLESLGAEVEEVSIPLHDDSWEIYVASLAEGVVAAFEGEGLGHNWKGWYNTSWVQAFGKARRAQGADFPPSIKLALLLGGYTRRRYHSKYYAEAMNLRGRLTREYDAHLQTYDVLAMPTTPQTAHEYVPDQDRFDFIDDAWGSLHNTAAFDMTGHPALSVPVEPVGKLPVGLMLVGNHFDDATVLNVGHAVLETG